MNDLVSYLLQIDDLEAVAVSAVDNDSPPYNEFTYSILPIHGMSEYFHIICQRCSV